MFFIQTHKHHTETEGHKYLSNNCSRMAVPFSGDVFLNIPTPIITDILARLTPDAVGRCRCVCKAWLKLLSEAEFVNLHLSKSQTGLIVHKLSGSPPDSASFSQVEVEDESDHHGVRYIAGMDKKIPRRGHMGMTMIGSINGLVCINEFAYEYELIHVWNPIMGEFITIQTPEGEELKYPNVVTYGFGISSGKYQVVRIFQKIELTGSETYSQQIRQSTCHVYTIGAAGFWKNIGHAPYLYSCRSHGLFLNGNLHWLVYDQNDPDQICCLDLERESFQPFPPPPELPQSHLATLNLYKGCISVCDNTSDFDIVIWVMKEYGVENSWIKEVVISKHLIDLVGNYYEVVHIIKVFEDGEILLLWRDDKLFSYHPNWKTVQDLDVQKSMTGPSNEFLPPCFEATEYVSSIVSLKNLGEVNIYRGRG